MSFGEHKCKHRSLCVIDIPGYLANGVLLSANNVPSHRIKQSVYKEVFTFFVDVVLAGLTARLIAVSFHKVK